MTETRSSDRTKGRPSPRTNATHRIEPRTEDPYRHQRKTGDAVVCEDCSVVFHGGRWYWGAAPLCDVEETVCPACQRIRDRFPAGTIRMADVPEEWHDEVVRMIHSVEAHEKAEHPLERLMEIDDHGDSMTATTTGMHLARCIAGALRRRFHDGVKIGYPEGEGIVTVDWVD